MKTKAFRAALPYTLPICVGFLFLGMSYGFFMRSQGFSFVYPLLMSLFIFAGSMEFVTANLLLLPTFQPVHAFLLTIMVNARHLFYGLSLLDKFKLEDIWTHSNVQKLTDKTITDLEELRSQLVEVRANGYAIDDEENELGVRCVAVAIPGADGRAESAFSISGLAPYMTPERIRRIATLALDARTDILADLGLR